MLARHRTRLSLPLFVAMVWLLTGALAACSGGDGADGAGQGDVTMDAGTPDVADEDTPAEDVAGPTGACEGRADGAPCEDGNVCTTEDVCEGGLCVGGVNVACDEQGACTQGSCDPATGCVYEALEDGTACDVTCFDAATCQGGTCAVDPATAVLCPEPEGLCVDQLGCDPGTGECTVEIYEPLGVDCDTDEDLCTYETCDGLGACQGTGETETCASENTDNPCWTYTCNAKSGCVATNFVEGVSCNDHNPCTYSDLCTLNQFGQETCLGEAIPTDDSNPCTDDACVDGTVSHTPVDGVPCVSDDSCALPGTCDGGQCVAEGSCGCVANTDCAQPEDTCSGAITCVDGQCALDTTTAVVCGPASVPCSASVCDPATGICGATPLDDSSACVPSDTTCSQTGTCQAGTCAPDVDCECLEDADCTSDVDLCGGKMVCSAEHTCELDTSQGVVCPPGPTPCEGFVCAPDTGLCNPVSWANGTPCTPTDTVCGEDGTCQMGVCEPAGQCPTVEAVYVLDGIDSTLKRSFDAGDSWEDVSTLPAPPPSLVTMTRGGQSALYVGIYFNTSDAADAGYTPGNQIFRSDDEGFTWQHVGSWNDGSSASALCAGDTPTLLYGTDTAGGIHRSDSGGATFPVVGGWGVQGAMVDCVVAPSGLVVFADAAYCGEPAEDGCAAVWASTDSGLSATAQGNYTPQGSGNKAALDVDLDGNLWAVGNDHDIYRSDDDGQTWTMAGSVPSLKGIGDLVAADDGALYAGTPTSGCGGDCDPATAGGEFYVSTDGGVSWTKSASQWTPGGNGSGWMALVTAHVATP
jgi:hypothetical protein